MIGSPKILFRTNFELSPREVASVRSGDRGCSCNGSDLRELGEKCANTALEKGALSWSIYPIHETKLTHPQVYVEFHNWPEMGMCNFKKPIGKPRYWWDVRPIAEYIAPSDERAVRDDAGLDRGQAFNPEE